MSVYVDETKSSAGDVVRRVLMSDESIEQLNAMAASVGMPTVTFTKRQLPHYQLSHDQMRLAIEKGAVIHIYNSAEWRAVHRRAKKLPR